MIVVRRARHHSVKNVKACGCTYLFTTITRPSLHRESRVMKHLRSNRARTSLRHLHQQDHTQVSAASSADFGLWSVNLPRYVSNLKAQRRGARAAHSLTDALKVETLCITINRKGRLLARCCRRRPPQSFAFWPPDYLRETYSSLFLCFRFCIMVRFMQKKTQMMMMRHHHH